MYYYELWIDDQLKYPPSSIPWHQYTIRKWRVFLCFKSKVVIIEHLWAFTPVKILPPNTPTTWISSFIVYVWLIGFFHCTGSYNIGQVDTSKWPPQTRREWIGYFTTHFLNSQLNKWIKQSQDLMLCNNVSIFKSSVKMLWNVEKLNLTCSLQINEQFEVSIEVLLLNMSNKYDEFYQVWKLYLQNETNLINSTNNKCILFRDFDNCPYV